MTIAFFDVDNTLMKGYSGFYTALILLQKKLIKKRRLLQALAYRLVIPVYKVNILDVYRTVLGDMAGSQLDYILAVGRECFDRWIKSRVYQEAIEKISEHRAKGHLIYLVTSAPYMTIDALSKFLGANGHFSNGPIVDPQGKLTSSPNVPLFYREGKIVAAEKAILENKSDWKECYYYGDSIDDIFLLEKVGHPFMVNPDRELKKIGLSRGWPELNFSKLLGVVSR